MVESLSRVRLLNDAKKNFHDSEFQEKFQYLYFKLLEHCCRISFSPHSHFHPLPHYFPKPRKRQERNISFSFIFLLQLSPPLCDLGASSPHCLFLSSPYLLFTEGKSSLPLQDPSKEISENS